MKTLIYTLALQGHGTGRLSRALTGIGLEGGHEVLGQGMYGSVKDVPNFLEKGIQNGPYPKGTPEGGLVGDNRIAQAYFDWAPIRRYSVYDGSVQIVGDAYARFLVGEGFFVDIGFPVAEFYTLVEKVTGPTRSIHVSRDGREWVRKLMGHGFTEDSMHYGSVHTYETIYPTEFPRWKTKTRFEKCCLYWVDAHQYFLRAKRPLFHVEDYNDPDTACDILDLLYPEAGIQQAIQFNELLRSDDYVASATPEQEKARKLRHPKAPRHPHWTDWDDAMMKTFNAICGDTMKELRYY